MRRSRHVGWVGVAAFVLGVGGIASAADVREGWAVLSEASTDGYLRDLVHSRPTALRAITRLPEVAKSPRPRQRAAAEALIEVIGKKTVADAEAALKLGQMKADEKQARFLMVVGGLAASAGDAQRNLGRMVGPKNMPDPGPDPNNGVDALFLGTMNALGGSATQMAEAQEAASAARLAVREAWQSKVFPAVRNLKAGELRASPLKVEITDASSREVWSVLRNVSGKALTNVTVVLKGKDNGKDLRTQIYFVRDWPESVVIRPDSFHRRIMYNGNPGVDPPSSLSATFEVWSDQGHADPADAKVVGFFDLRDPFVETIVREGARYVHLGEDAQMVLEFTKVAKDGNGRTVEAKLTRPQPDAPDKLQELRYSGRWVPNRSQKGPYLEVVGLKLKLNQLDAAPLPDRHPPPVTRKRRGAQPPAAPPRYPSLDFEWYGSRFRVALHPGEEFLVQPLPDAKAEK